MQFNRDYDDDDDGSGLLGWLGRSWFSSWGAADLDDVMSDVTNGKSVKNMPDFAMSGTLNDSPSETRSSN